MKILYEDNHLLVVVKPVNVPVCEDESKDEDLLNMLKKYLKEKYNKPGNVYLGLVHRLDRPVSGVMVFAKTSKAASRLSEQIRLKQFKKEYHAIVIGKVDKGIYKDNLLKDKKTNITKVDKNGKESILEYELVKYVNNYSLVKINLKTGRSHQIRVQFSYHNHPLVGDNKYNKMEVKKIPVCLFANKLTFYHPITKEELVFEQPLPNCYPWNLF
ncbi:MAG TPA: RNA pseudouridine synthase [Candidatus Faecisoma merdavium]|nr:RNA pseudouridine synthase [Candidatus Faecisoma merdavium]